MQQTRRERREKILPRDMFSLALVNHNCLDICFICDICSVANHRKQNEDHGFDLVR